MRLLPFPLLLALALACPAAAQQQVNITFTDPDTVGTGHTPGTDGILVYESQNFREAGLQVESFWVKNDETAFSAGHYHHLEQGYETSHGFETTLGLGPDRQGFYLEREDGGTFGLASLRYKLTNLTSAEIGVATDIDPTTIMSTPEQMTLFPVSGTGYQTLNLTGFEDVSQLFVMPVLGIDQQQRIEFDDFQILVPAGSCNDVPRNWIYYQAGPNDPESLGWIAEGGGVGVVTGPTASGWSIDDTSPDLGSWLRYSAYPDPDETCWARFSGWKLTVEVALPYPDDPPDASVFAHYFDGLTAWELRLGTDASGDPIADVGGTVATLTGLGPGAHMYELRYDPATQTVDLDVDGLPVITGASGEVVRVSAPRISFGSDDEAGTGYGDFSYVSFSLASHCEDGVDNDGDGLIDFGGDPGCAAPGSVTESPVCQDGVDNDGDGAFDFDGGASANGGVALGPADPQCTTPTGGREAPIRRGCGIGFELALLLPPLMRRRFRLRRS